MKLTTPCLQDQLLAQQMVVRVGEGEAITIDENSVLRNHILVKSFLLGGSGERLLPPHTLNDALPSSPVSDLGVKTGSVCS